MRLFSILAALVAAVPLYAATVDDRIALSQVSQADGQVHSIDFLQMSRAAFGWAQMVLAGDNADALRGASSETLLAPGPGFPMLSDGKDRLLLRFRSEGFSGQAAGLFAGSEGTTMHAFSIFKLSLPLVVVCVATLFLWPALHSNGLYPRSPRRYRRVRHVPVLQFRWRCSGRADD